MTLYCTVVTSADTTWGQLYRVPFGFGAQEAGETAYGLPRKLHPQIPLKVDTIGPRRIGGRHTYNNSQVLSALSSEKGESHPTPLSRRPYFLCLGVQTFLSTWFW